VTALAWQASLFGTDEPRPDAGFVSCARVVLEGGGGRSRRYDLGEGDLLVIGGTCQHTWEHCVPKARHAGPRLSVTFRHSQEPDRTG
jgi:hypothetical protein